MNDKFDIKLVHDNFLTSLHEDDDVKLKEYLYSYEELNKFCNLMGVVFGFVSKDLRSKMDILYEFLNNQETLEHFQTAKKMIEYEKGNELLFKKGYTSGSRTLLRLHRGLDFIRVFLKNVGDLQDSDNTSAVCRAAYDQTLSNHHTFMVRSGARLAMHTMPTREQLLKKICGDNSEDIQHALDMLPKMLEITSSVFDRIDNLYTVNDLHSLP
ncbi:hypothetical protein ILUMI_19962 [Ignelater luminosus]|uniref:Glycolipid transfer protein domain-containing protein n=1 Tax=Ignelater luminosus TaxID=2038154 RepID=A0A8K0G2Q2_IGNLU|nr:hypothetical protein ILUMI_19962 [Ignelater luminosus]